MVPFGQQASLQEVGVTVSLVPWVAVSHVEREGTPGGVRRTHDYSKY